MNSFFFKLCAFYLSLSIAVSPAEEAASHMPRRPAASFEVKFSIHRTNYTCTYDIENSSLSIPAALEQAPLTPWPATEERECAALLEKIYQDYRAALLFCFAGAQTSTFHANTEQAKLLGGVLRQIVRMPGLYDDAPDNAWQKAWENIEKLVTQTYCDCACCTFLAARFSEARIFKDDCFVLTLP